MMEAVPAFRALVDEHLAWPYALRTSDPHTPLPEARLLANPEMWMDLDHAPSAVQALARACPDIDQRGAVWIGDARTRLVWPIWLGPYLRPIARSIFPGQPLRFLLPSSARRTMIACGMLATEAKLDEDRASYQALVADGRATLVAGYAEVSQLVHPAFLAAIGRHYRGAVRAGRFRTGDPQSPRRLVAHDESATKLLHHIVAPLVATLMNAEIKPSYSYVASYQPGARLPRHVDREQCEYSVTTLLDHAPEPVGSSPWPLYLETPVRRIRVSQSPGDGLVYRGRQIPHYREEIPADTISTSAFLHYVDQDFHGRLA